MSIPPAKRQRTDAASIALSKPFRSPMKNPLTAKNLVPLPGEQSRSEAAPNSILRTPFTPLRKGVNKPIFPSPISSIGPNLDPDIATLTKAQQQLEKHLREVKEELETVEQARRIELDSEKKNPGKEIDEELVRLILKWRAASRQAAEELFTSVRDRVNRMGGPKAWKEMQDKQKEFRRGWDVEPPPQIDSDNEDGRSQENKDLYADYDTDQETANEKEARRGNESPQGEGIEDVNQPKLQHIIKEIADISEGFTMAMMLRSLQVPLKTIGYNRDEQRWGE